MMASDSVRQVYEMTSSAVKGREAMKAAVRLGLAQQYHRTLRANPHALVADPLLAVRRQLGDLMGERKRLGGDALGEQQVDEAMEQIAEGALLWVNERLGGGGAK